MTDRTNNDIAALLTPPPSHGVEFSQGVILSWDHERLENQIEWRGITLTDVPIVEGVNALSLTVGDVVGILGWSPENAKGVGSWWILGKLTNPGEFVSDLTFYLGQVRFRTYLDEFDQVYFGRDDDDEPFTVLYYGDEDSTRALEIFNRDTIRLRDPSGNIIVANDAATDVGLARPYLYYHMAPTFNAELVGTVLVPATTSATYVAIYEGRPHVWHPKVSYDIAVSATGVTDWRLLVNGTVVFTGSPSASGDIEIPGWGSDILPGQAVIFTLEARNTGAGFSRIAIRRFEGRQT
jgi:hypothetical protein